MNRVFKKLIYGLFFLFIFILIFYGVFKNNLTLKKETKEVNVLPLEIISKPKILYLNKDYSVLVFKLFNPNQDYGLNSFLYNLELYDLTDNFLKNILATSYIYPKEEKYFVIFLDEKFYRQVKRVDFKLENFNYLAKDIFIKPLLKFKNVSFNELDDNRILVKIKINNLSNFDLEKVNLVFLFYNDNNQLISAYNYNLEDILLKESEKDVEFIINFDSETKKEIDFDFAKVFIYGK